ncbi:asparagine synthase (glutamine-hydrolyzing) [Polynucleobacter sp. 15G-AUS-farblos]|uniref:asparagine synthase (glutamine-hydrolyzing) n=1 Tax=Polynucleobacter sp. 15G-AUS-farblos TaxID=2689094 RepID=UPI001C0C23F3|nr:asparagine synthase (glutamine-hydrolyzing) [Polynucleobacter sp. 15G-AUS-farblos]MBU3584089.1 asparagine synthase (glutamine-hydrolyzing) [Polynucleobacter sp. 15G-AUS-farblos]
MCGIAGVIGKGGDELVPDMLLAMRHRGPDDFGIYHHENTSLGMVRLSILDISAHGHQPMKNADDSIVIVYNGEAYNFLSERKILENKGYLFRSNSDTEVVLLMYQEYGEDFLLRLRGMFALAIYDKRKGPGFEKLLLARDPLGIKPLLYCMQKDSLIFGSELKMLLASNQIESVIDPESLRLLLTFGSVTQPRTMIKDVHMLMPGCKLIYEQGKVIKSEYWKFQENQISGLGELPQDQLVDLTMDAIDKSVSLEMVSDVSVGAFLSGGIDSAIMVAMMAKNSTKPIKTFSVGFEGEENFIDETTDAAATSNFLGTDHQRVVITGNDVKSHIYHIASALDQPSVDGVNSYFVSLAASKEVKVAISGTGGDELFGGYPWFSVMNEYIQSEINAIGARASLERVISNFSRNVIFNPLIQSPLALPLDVLRSRSGYLPKFSRLHQIFGPIDSIKYLSPQIRKKVSTGQDPSIDFSLADRLADGDAVNRASVLCLRGYTLNQLLRDIDSASMAHSLEVRVPFLDVELVNLALSLPVNAKLDSSSLQKNLTDSSYRALGAKKILVDISSRIFSENMVTRAKRGFSMPFESWLRKDLRDVLEDTLSERSVKARGLLNVNEVSKLKTAFLNGQMSWVRPWLLMMLELWCREVLDVKNTNSRKALVT